LNKSKTEEMKKQQKIRDEYKKKLKRFDPILKDIFSKAAGKTHLCNNR
jgi:hypothetical protein